MEQNELLALLKPETQRIDRVMAEDLKIIDNRLLAEVTEYAIFNGGKRIRPLLTILAAKLCWMAGGSPADQTAETELYKMALTFEYLHAASLLHDDVIDHADQRRGKKAANKVWSNTHVILAGDFLHTRAMLLAGTGGGSECLAKIYQATSAMVESEFLQLQNAQTVDSSEENYFKVLKGKTAALIAAACETGAIFAQGRENECAAIALFGANLGLTFQIVDDLLDYLGDAKKTGKAVGNDFQEGKMTLPLLYAVNRGDPEDRKLLDQLLADSSMARRQAIDQGRRIIERSGGFSYARGKAESLINEAVTALEIFPDGAEKGILTALSKYVLKRER